MTTNAEHNQARHYVDWGCQTISSWAKINLLQELLQPKDGLQGIKIVTKTQTLFSSNRSKAVK